MTTNAEDRSTWPRNGQIIRRDELLRLIEGNDGPEGLDLRGAIFVGDGPSDHPWENPIDLSPDALAPVVKDYPQAVAEEGGINLEGAQLRGSVLRDAGLQRAVLRDARLQRADLTGVHLHAANLLNAHLQEACLQWAQLQRVDMYGVTSLGLDAAHWHEAFLDHTRIKRESLGRAIGDEVEAHKSKKPQAYHEAKEAYLLLKNNFNQIGRYEDASWAYVKEQQMEKMAYHWEWRSHGWQFWRAWGPFGRWLRNWAYELLTGYGERPWNAVAAGGLIVFLLAVVYWLAGALSGRARPGWFTSFNPGDIDWAGFLDGIIYSLATFATFNLARPAINPEGRVWEAVSSVEAILGISVLALVVFTVGNRMSRS